VRRRDLTMQVLRHIQIAIMRNVHSEVNGGAGRR
jgi:hypothetical protein